MQTPKATPRFLPTLTEVVKPSGPIKNVELTQVPSEPGGQALATEDALIGAVMQSLLPTLEIEIEKALRQSLQVHLELLLPTVLADVHAAVRFAVRNAAQPNQDF